MIKSNYVNSPVRFVKKHGKSASERIGNAIAYVVLIVACLLVLLPFSIVLSTSFKTLPDAVKIPFKFYMGYLDLTGYKEVFALKSFYTGLGNTLIITLPSMVFGVFSSALASFAFAKIPYKAKNFMFGLLMASMMLPGVITMTPAYVLFDYIFWTDTYLPLMIPTSLGTASCIFYLKQYFASIPDELLEAAELDGLGKFGTFCRILLPLSKPAIIAQCILWIIAGYNDYFGPMLYLETESKYTLQLVLKLMTGTAASNWPKIMACCIVIMMPMLLIYFFAQKQFMEGIVMTGLKA